MTDEPVQKVVVGCRRATDERDDDFAARIQELIGLCEAAGGQVVETLTQTRPDIHAGLYLGSGKIEEIADAVERTLADVVVFDGELTPGQIRNLEQRIPCRVLDRTQLILDIFALRARSGEGRLQVEIAQLQYLLPRLTGRGVELSRLGGGIGTRGPGETKLETDRRRIRQRIDHLRQQIETVRKSRATQRARRVRSVPVVALVGYTNAGKSTLLRRWTADRGTDRAERGHSRLFDTLDPVSRRVRGGATGDIVLLDTVGFVQDLPHLLVDAFRATLEEVLAADLIVHVVDACGDAQVRLQTTYDVLREVGAMDKPVVTFFNKMDAAEFPPPPDVHAAVTLYGSAASGFNIDRLYAEVEQRLGMDTVELVFTGHADSAFWSELSKMGRVLEAQALSEDTVAATVAVERRVAERVLHNVTSANGYEVRPVL